MEGGVPGGSLCSEKDSGNVRIEERPAGSEEMSCVDVQGEERASEKMKTSFQKNSVFHIHQ